MPIDFDWSKMIAELPGNPIPGDWINTKGKTVKVAFVDTGANLGLASLNHLNVPGRKFFVGAPDFSPLKMVGQDAVGEVFGTAGNGHGTLYASVLAGRAPATAPPDKDLIIGIAGDADYFIIKATTPDGEQTKIRHLLNAFRLAAGLGIDIIITGQCISISEMGPENLTPDEIISVFNLLKSKNIFVFAPIKNRKSASAWPDIVENHFPSFHEDVFNVAALPEVFQQVSDQITAQNIPFLLAGFHGKVISKTGIALEIGPAGASDIEFFNSSAVSVMGGIAVLALSHFKQNNGGAKPSRAQLAQMLGACGRPIADAFGDFDKPAIFKNF